MKGERQRRPLCRDGATGGPIPPFARTPSHKCIIDTMHLQCESNETCVTCQTFNATACKLFGNDSSECSGLVKCEACYLLFNVTDRPEPYFKGCWNSPCDNISPICYSSGLRNNNKNTSYSFCCCNSDECNSNVTILQPPSTTIEPPSLHQPESSNYFASMCIFLIMIAVIGSVFLWYFRKKNQRQFSGVPTSDDTLQQAIVSVPSQPIGPVHSLEEKAKGKFGSVYKGQLGHGDPVQYVAVKVFPLQDRDSWTHECEIYRLPQMKHENILKFLDSQDVGDSYWLITEYQELGSLHDYLKANVVSYHDLLKISKGIASGLALLHQERPATDVEGLKPTVAHRDFKSKNVILKLDLTPCIADFGLARIFPPSEPHIEALGQVGTRKYMAPEVLDGAICHARDFVLWIDMYACGLVLWELVSRCSAQLDPVPPYKLPFDDEVGPNPTLEEMAEVVVGRKQRPKLPKFWKEYEEEMKTISYTIEELWDHDAEARLSSVCVEKRLEKILNNSTETARDTE